MPTLAIVVVSYNAAEVLLRCLAAARPVAEALGAEVIVIDNGSPDGSADRVAAEFPRFRLFRRPNLGFAAGVNFGVASTPARRLLLLNPDCFLEEPALRRCLATLDATPGAAAVSCRVVGEDGLPNNACRPFPTLTQYLLERFGSAAPYPPVPDPPRPVDVDSISGAFFLLTREAWSKVGPFDDGFFLYFEETDWCRRAKDLGFRVLHEPRAAIVHIGGASTSTIPEKQGARGLLMRAYLDSRERFWRKHYGRLATLGMTAASVAVSTLSLAIPRPRGPGSSHVCRNASLEWFRIRHALHLTRRYRRSSS